MCMLVCVHRGKYRLTWVGGLRQGLLPRVLCCTWTAWPWVERPSLPLSLPPSFSAKRELIYLGPNCGWANAAGWVLFRVIIPPCVLTNNGLSPLHSFCPAWSLGLRCENSSRAFGAWVLFVPACVCVGHFRWRGKQEAACHCFKEDTGNTFLFNFTYP